MREIKFRAKRKLNGKWVYGSLVRNTESEDWDFIVDNNCDNNWDYCNIITNTIGQFTGLKDKNGKEIYEGDILKYDLFGTYAVKWSDDKALFGLFIVDGDNSNTICSYPFTDSKSYEIIGNIHDGTTDTSPNQNS